MMEGMKILQPVLLLVAFLNHYGINGQVTEPLSTAAALGDDVSLECTTTATGDVNFVWADGDTGLAIYTGPIRATGDPDHANIVLGTSSDQQTSILLIDSIEMNDDGNYSCYLAGQLPSPDETVVTVEVGSQPQGITLTSNNTHYQATCEALESKPAETITWFLNNEEQSDGIEVTIPNPPPASPLSSRRSTFTFLATKDNFNVTLRCIIGGHQVTRLNREETRMVDIHNPPEEDGIKIGFNEDDPNLVISCNINDAVDAAIPAMDAFYIYENGTLVNKPLSASSVTVTLPEQDTVYKCVGANYLGNTTAEDTFYPGRTTTPSPPTEPSTPEGFNTVPPTPAQITTTTPMAGDGNNTSKLSGTDGLSAGAIAGIAIGSIAVIVIIIIVVIYFMKNRPGGSSSSGVSAKKHTSSTVGTSNGSEKEKIKPVAAPRDQGSIQHTTDNPGQAEYAMVDRKKSGGGDMPDTRGPSHDSPGMHYADLDLSTNAGHTERQVPQNPDNVVVYSSILV